MELSNLSIVLVVIFTAIAFFFLKSLRSMYNVVRNYRKLGKEEFMSRWKQGISSVTSTQQTKAQFPFHIIITIGIIIGIYITFRADTYWLTAILVGSLGLEIIGFFGTYQKYLLMKGQDDILNNLNKTLGGLNEEKDKRQSQE